MLGVVLNDKMLEEGVPLGNREMVAVTVDVGLKEGVEEEGREGVRRVVKLWVKDEYKVGVMEAVKLSKTLKDGSQEVPKDLEFMVDLETLEEEVGLGLNEKKLEGECPMDREPEGVLRGEFEEVTVPHPLTVIDTVGVRVIGDAEHPWVGVVLIERVSLWLNGEAEPLKVAVTLAIV